MLINFIYPNSKFYKLWHLMAISFLFCHYFISHTHIYIYVCKYIHKYIHKYTHTHIIFLVSPFHEGSYILTFFIKCTIQQIIALSAYVVICKTWKILCVRINYTNECEQPMQNEVLVYLTSSTLSLQALCPSDTSASKMLWPTSKKCLSRLKMSIYISVRDAQTMQVERLGAFHLAWPV